MPLMAEGEFVLVREYLQAASTKPVSSQGLLFHDNEMNFMFVDLLINFLLLAFTDSLLMEIINSSLHL